MAIIQISKIQIRTGDYVDLPVLDSGEFGYATDDNRLFIGNTGALLPEDNTEIVTYDTSVNPASAASTTTTHKLPIVINGTTYYIALTATP